MNLYQIIDEFLQNGSVSFPALILKHREALALTGDDYERLLIELYEEKTTGKPSLAMRRLLERALLLQQGEDHIKEAKESLFLDGTQALVFLLEEFLGRAISTRDLNILNQWVYDLGFGEEIIAFLLKSCKDLNRKSIAYADAVAKNWKSRGITTLEEAERASDMAKKLKAEILEIKKYLGLPKTLTRPEETIYQKWKDELGFTKEMILLASDYTIHTGRPSFGYIKGILEDWHHNGIHTLSEAKSYLSNYKNKGKNKTNKKHGDSSTISESRRTVNLKLLEESMNSQKGK